MGLKVVKSMGSFHLQCLQITIRDFPHTSFVTNIKMLLNTFTLNIFICKVTKLVDLPETFLRVLVTSPFRGKY